MSKGQRSEKDFPLEKLRKVIRELRDSLVIVEGKKDVLALREFGIRNVIPINGMPLDRFIRTLAGRTAGPAKIRDVGTGKQQDSEEKVLTTGFLKTCDIGSGFKGSLDSSKPAGGFEITILTDFDKEGRRLAAKLRKYMQRYKLRPNTRLRREMMSFGKNKIEDFGKLAWKLGLTGEIKNIRSDNYGKTSTNID